MGKAARQAGVARGSRSTRRVPTRLSVKLTTAALAAVIAALAFGGCGNDSEIPANCSRCCACECAGTTCLPLKRSESEGCVDCNQVCPAVCAEDQCTVASARSCDGEPYCSCMCVFYDCPAGVAKESAPVCLGYDCPTCTILCRDEWIRKGCAELLEVYAGVGECGATLPG